MDSQKEEVRKGGNGTERRSPGPLAREGGLFLDICTGAL